MRPDNRSTHPIRNSCSASLSIEAGGARRISAAAIWLSGRGRAAALSGGSARIEWPSRERIRPNHESRSDGKAYGAARGRARILARRPTEPLVTHAAATADHTAADNTAFAIIAALSFCHLLNDMM